MSRKPAPQLTPDLEDKLRDRLEELLDERDTAADRRRRVGSHLSAYVRRVDDSVTLCRRQLKGQELEQLEVPGTELPEPEKDPLVAEILRIAGGLPRKPGGLAAKPGTPGGSEPLAWRGSAEEGKVYAETLAGVYRIEQNEGTREGWTAKWEPHAGRGKLLAIAKPLEECKDACRQHAIDKMGDDLLEKGGG